jgi:ribosomal protein L11 methyltransferase
MDKKTVKSVFKIIPFTEESGDILLSILIDMGYEGFENLENEILAYIPEDLYNKENLNEICFSINQKHVIIEHYSEILEEKNWNKIWEENFQPVVIKDKCLIYAGFHKLERDFTHKILIDPKMSFGTGHHETTRLVIESMLEINFENKEVLDMGCGTGILAILASQKGANRILAIDNDKWAYENTVENIKNNNVKNIEILHGDAALLGNQTFGIIIANINRNILLDDINKYSMVLEPEGLLLLSGFYSEDIEAIKAEAKKNNLVYEKHFELKNWVCLHCRKEK